MFSPSTMFLKRNFAHENMKKPASKNGTDQPIPKVSQILNLGVNSTQLNHILDPQSLTGSKIGFKLGSNWVNLGL